MDSAAFTCGSRQSCVYESLGRENREIITERTLAVGYLLF